jgi:TIR domain-containing protein
MQRAISLKIWDIDVRPMLDLFLSHGGRSQAEVAGLLHDLRALGGVVWFDEAPRNGHLAWEHSLSRLRGCDGLIFAVTKGSLESEACWRQASYAQALMKPVLPVLLSDRLDMNAMPASLRTIQLVDYRKRNSDALLSLGNALRAFAKGRALPRVLPLPPAPPPPDLSRLRDRIGASGKLALVEQAALVEELGQEVRDMRSSLEARQLLLLLRRRRDVSPDVIGHIDALLRKTAATQMKLRPPSWQESASFRGSPSTSPARSPSDRAASPALRRLSSSSREVSPAALALRWGLSQRTAIAFGGLMLGAAGSWITAWGLREGGPRALDVGRFELQGSELAGLLVVGAVVAYIVGKGSVGRAVLGTLVGVLALILGVVFFE